MTRQRKAGRRTTGARAEKKAQTAMDIGGAGQFGEGGAPRGEGAGTRQRRRRGAREEEKEGVAHRNLAGERHKFRVLVHIRVSLGVHDLDVRVAAVDVAFALGPEDQVAELLAAELVRPHAEHEADRVHQV